MLLPGPGPGMGSHLCGEGAEKSSGRCRYPAGPVPEAGRAHTSNSLPAKRRHGSPSSLGATADRGGGAGLPETHTPRLHKQRPRGRLPGPGGGPAPLEAGGQSGAPRPRRHPPGSGPGASAGTRRAHARPGPAGAPGMRGGGGRAASEGGRAAVPEEPAGHRPPRAPHPGGGSTAGPTAPGASGAAAPEPRCAPVCVQSESAAPAPGGRQCVNKPRETPPPPALSPPRRSPRRPAAAPARRQVRRGAFPPLRRPPLPRPPAQPAPPALPHAPTPAHTARGCPWPLQGKVRGPPGPAGQAAPSCGCVRGGIMCHNKLLNVTLLLNCGGGGRRAAAE